MSPTETTPTHKGLAAALLAFQQEAPKLPKDGRNPHFNSKFTKLDTIREKVGPLLVKHGLVWQTFPSIDEQGRPALTYRLTHAASSEVSEGTMPLLLAKQDPQGLGSALTYARRYSVTAVLDLVADEDGDGHAGSTPPSSRATSSNGGQVASGLAEDTLARVLAAVKQARMPHDWLRMQLVALGVEDVPEGPIMQSTIRALSDEQATKLIELCADVVQTRERVEAAGAK